MPSFHRQETNTESNASTGQKIADQIKILEQKERNIESLKKIIIRHTVQLEQRYGEHGAKNQEVASQRKRELLRGT